MPKGPQGQKRPGDTIGAAILVAKIATGEIEEVAGKPARAKGGKARAKALAPKQRSEIASLAAQARWKKP
jgi:hypothetical protein